MSILGKSKAVFTASITGQITTVGLATTYTGLCLSNPNNTSAQYQTGTQLVITKIGIALLVVQPAGAVVGLMRGISTTNVTQGTPVTPFNQWKGAGAGVGLAASAATLQGTPVLTNVLGAALTGAITTTPAVNGLYSFEEGEIVIPPGGYVAIYMSTASGTASGAFSFEWLEIPY